MTPSQRKAYAAFHPLALRQTEQFESSGRPFVHYTRADTALKIISGGEFWMRQASRMNDASETQHGAACLAAAFVHSEGVQFRANIDSIYSNLTSEVKAEFDAIAPTLRSEVFLTSISEHGDSESEEDFHGRLSMWRAYGIPEGVALILNPAPFLTPSNALGVVTSPVAYLRAAGFIDEMKRMNASFAAHRPYIIELQRDGAKRALANMFFFAAICAKHPGFREEQEWRVICAPRFVIPKGIRGATVGAGNQQVFRIPMKNTGDLKGASLPEFIQKVIVGPTESPDAICASIIDALTKAGVSDAANRVIKSDIPYRHQP